MTLTVEQVADRLQLDKTHIRELLRDGTIPGFKRGKRVWGVLLVELEKWLSQRGNQKPDVKP